MKKFLNDVDAPKDKIIRNRDLKRILEHDSRLNDNDVSYLLTIINGNDIVDVSGFSGVTTLLCMDNLKKGYVIRIGDKNHKLDDIFIKNNFLNKYNLTSKTIDYYNGCVDILVTEPICGKMVLDEYCDLELMAKFMGESLRKFHEYSFDINELDESERKILLNDSNYYINTALSHANGLRYFGEYLGVDNYTRLKKEIDAEKNLFKNTEVMVHGDFNPRNVFVNNNQFAGVVDLEYMHFGDRHYDIAFSVWSCCLYLGVLNDIEKVNYFKNIFYESYGLDIIDFNRLNYCNKVVCMFWQEHNDINSLGRG